MFDAYTGTYNDLCHIICYFRKLQAPRSALVCGATCGMHVFAGFVWQIFRTFQTWNRLWREAEQVAKFIQNVTNIFIFHLTQSFRPATSSGHLQSDEIPTAKSLTGTLQRIRSAPETQLCKVWLKTWKRFYSDGKCPLDGTWCQKNNGQFSYKGEITPEETDR